MNNELETKLKEIVVDVIGRAEGYKHNNDMSVLSSGDLNDWFLPEAIAQIHQAYEDVGYITKRKPVNHIFDCLYCGKHNELHLAPSQIEIGYNPKYCDQACRSAHNRALRQAAHKAVGLEYDND